MDDDEKVLFDMGCGNGSVAQKLSQAGWKVTGVDASPQGIEQAQKNFPHLYLKLGSAYDDLEAKYGQFPVCLSLEVVEHLYNPRLYAKNLFQLVKTGGTVIVSTPFHGYFKNLAISILNKWDSHFTSLWDGGHIKFWSPKTLSILLREAGFQDVHFYYVGRIPFLAKSMIAVALKPHQSS